MVKKTVIVLTIITLITVTGFLIFRPKPSDEYLQGVWLVNGCEANIDATHWQISCKGKSTVNERYKINKKYYKTYKYRKCSFFEITIGSEQWLVIFPYGLQISNFEMTNKVTQKTDIYDVPPYG